MAIFMCNTCGKTFTVDRSCDGMRVRCPECHNQADEIDSICSDFVCKECGLSCSKEDVKCPACGGDIVPKSSIGPTEYEIQEQKDNAKADSFWENFVWGLIFAPRLGLWLIIWLASVFGIVKKPKWTVGAGLFAGTCCAIILYCVLAYFLTVFRTSVSQ